MIAAQTRTRLPGMAAATVRAPSEADVAQLTGFQHIKVEAQMDEPAPSASGTHARRPGVHTDERACAGEPTVMNHKHHSDLRLTPDPGQLVVWSGGLVDRLGGLVGQLVFVL